MRLVLTFAVLLCATINTPAQETWAVLQRFSGSSAFNSPPFALPTDCRVRWKVKGNGEFPELGFSAALYSTTGGMPQLIATASAANASHTYVARADTYRLEITAVWAKWEVIIEQRGGKPSRTVRDPFGPSPRTWTHKDGRTVEAYYVSSTTTHVVFERVSDGRIFTFPLADLSAEDHEFVDRVR